MTNTNAGAYDVTELRKRLRRNRRGVALTVAACLLGVGAVGGPALEHELAELRQRFVQRLISEELAKAPPDDASLNNRELQMRLAQERARNQDLIERITAVAMAVEIEN